MSTYKSSIFFSDSTLLREQEHIEKAMKRNRNKYLRAFPILPQLCSEIFLEGGQESFHHAFRILIGKGFVSVLNHETQGILFLTFRNLVTSVHVEQSDLLEKFLGLFESRSAKISITYALVKKESQVTPYRRELRQFGKCNLIPLYKFEENLPVDFSSKHRLLDAEPAGKRRRDCTH